MAGELTSAQRSQIRKKSAYHELDPSEAAGELNIIPFLDIVVNLIMFLLATTAAVLAISQIEASLPQLGRAVGSRSNAKPGLNLSVTLTENGIIVAGSGGKLAPGCENTAGGRVVTVPMLGGKYDWKGLTECVARIKSVPDFSDEDQVIVGADPTVQYEFVISAIDALRKKGDQELFPNVLLSAGVR